MEEAFESHPVWVRGLKQPILDPSTVLYKVAPRVGAWIETAPFRSLSPYQPVAPRVGAWIETVSAKFYKSAIAVAPRVGAWIETSKIGSSNTK